MTNIYAESVASLKRMQDLRATRAAAGCTFAMRVEAAQRRAEAERREYEQRERARLRKLLAVDEATRPTPDPSDAASAPPRRTRRALAFRERDIRRAITATAKAGLNIARTEIEPGGRIVIISGQPDATADQPANEWDAVR